MYKREVKVYETAKDGPPRTTRFVLCWNEKHLDSLRSTPPNKAAHVPGPQVYRFEKDTGIFWHGYTSMYTKNYPPDYWCFMESLEELK